MLNNSRTGSKAHSAYTKANKMTRKKMGADKRAYLDSLAVEAEEAAHHGNMRVVYAKTRKICGIFNKL